ncbi:MAG: ABC transporter ATP-binding protein [Clostridia bacterium]|nr:ABC transporter ATP-binding protein [Clostridia bacterium]
MAKKSRQKVSSVFKNNIYMLGQVAKLTPSYFVFMLMFGVVGGLMTSVSTVFTYHLLNSVEYGGDFWKIVKIIVLMAVFDIVIFAYHRWYLSVYNILMKKKLHMKMQGQLFKKAYELDLACFDDPRFYDDFVWAMDQADKRTVELVEDTFQLMMRVISSATLISLMMTIEPIIAVMMLVLSVTNVATNLISNKISFKQEREMNPLWRKRNYINRVYRLSDYAKEIRTSDVDDLLIDEYDKNNEEIIELSTKYGKKHFMLSLGSWIMLGEALYIVFVLYMITQLNSGEMQVGAFMAVINVYWRIRWQISDIINKFTKYVKHSLFIEKYREFLGYEPTVVSGDLPAPKFESLEIRDASFSYEFENMPRYKFHDENYSETKKAECKDVLKNVSLSIKAGEKIALVGYNGAGKTTLIKLIMRLYDVTDGEILYNGTNIKEFDVDEYRNKIGVVFQDYKIFAASIAENVMNGEYSSQTDTQTVLDALEKADFTDKLKMLENGIDTHLTREFDEEGTNLSGGEQQKIAIARVFAKNCDLMILDEPSSALDPIAEYKLNQAITEKTKDKTVIFIAHRLSTTRMADRIYMFESGKIVEEGSHEELMKLNGKYAEMFNVQAEKYAQK